MTTTSQASTGASMATTTRTYDVYERHRNMLYAFGIPDDGSRGYDAPPPGCGWREDWYAAFAAYQPLRRSRSAGLREMTGTGAMALGRIIEDVSCWSVDRPFFQEQHEKPPGRGKPPHATENDDG